MVKKRFTVNVSDLSIGDDSGHRALQPQVVASFEDEFFKQFGKGIMRAPRVICDQDRIVVVVVVVVGESSRCEQSRQLKIATGRQPVVRQRWRLSAG